MIIGTLYTSDYEGVEDVALLTDPRQLTHLLETVIVASGMQRIGPPLVHAFESQGEGLTYLVLLAQSHLAAHTWPEYRFLSVDFYTCGDPEMAQRALDSLRLCIPCREITTRVVERSMAHGVV